MSYNSALEILNAKWDSITRIQRKGDSYFEGYADAIDWAIQVVEKARDDEQVDS